MSCSSIAGYEVAVAQGATFYIKVVVKRDGLPVDLTGARAYFTVRHRIDDVAPILLKRSTGAGGSDAEIELLDQTTYPGQYGIKGLASDTKNLRYDKMYLWDTWIVLPNGDTGQVIGPAPFAVTPSITRFAV